MHTEFTIRSLQVKMECWQFKASLTNSILSLLSILSPSRSLWLCSSRMWYSRSDFILLKCWVNSIFSRFFLCSYLLIWKIRTTLQETKCKFYYNKSSVMIMMKSKKYIYKFKKKIEWVDGNVQVHGLVLFSKTIQLK